MTATVHFFYFLEHQNHAFDLIQELDLSQYNGIVIASGDGLLHEVSLCVCVCVCVHVCHRRSRRNFNLMNYP